MLKQCQEETKFPGKGKIEMLNLVLEVVLARDLGWLAEPGADKLIKSDRTDDKSDIPVKCALCLCHNMTFG